MEKLVIDKKFYSMSMERAEGTFYYIKKDFEDRSGKYLVLDSRGIDDMDRDVFKKYSLVLTAISLTDDVLDEKINFIDEGVPLSFMINDMKEEITKILGHY